MSSSILSGKAWKFGDDINTDIISSAEYMDQTYEIIGEHAMEKAMPYFASSITKGDFVVAGKNFGSGSSRETAQIALKYAGIGGIIAKDYARIFFRNCINVGLPVIICSQTDEINQDDILEVDLVNGRINDLTTGIIYNTSTLPANVMEIVNHGGLKGHLKYLKEQKEEL